MKRRTLLTLLAGVGATVSGCLGRSESPQQPTSSLLQGDSGGHTPTELSPTRGDGSRATTASQIPSCPEWPENETPETIAEYAVRFEKARQLQDVYQDVGPNASISSLTTRVSELVTERTENGWIVRLNVGMPSYKIEKPNGEIVYADGGITTANYFLSEQTVLRDTAIDPVDPRKYGHVVEC